jgi:hypothetical protein
MNDSYGTNMANIEVDEYGRPIKKQQKPSKGLGCFAWGCISLLIIFIGLAILIGYMAVKTLDSLVQSHGVTAPLQLPVIDPEPGEFAAVDYKIESFLERVRDGQATQPLVLSERELNVYATKEPIASRHFYIHLIEDRIKIEASIPLDMLGYEGKYVNASTIIKPEMKENALFLEVEDIELSGAPVPSEFDFGKLKGQNIAKDIKREDPKMAEFFEKLERIEINDGFITLTPKPVG